MPKVLITGGTGFVGYWVQQQAPAGYEVATLNRAQYERFDWATEHYDAIFHLANVTPGFVLDYAEFYGIPVVYTSSGAVYHDNPNQYGLNKREWELECLQSTARVRIARLFTFCGARLKWEYFAIGQFIRDAMKGGPIRILGDGNTVRSYLYGSDLGDWLWAILLKWGNRPVYDIGSDYRVSMHELACAVAHNFTPPPEILVENKMLFEQARVYLPYRLDVTRQELGVHQTVPFFEAVKRSIKDYADEK